MIWKLFFIGLILGIILYQLFVLYSKASVDEQKQVINNMLNLKCYAILTLQKLYKQLSAFCFVKHRTSFYFFIF